MRTHHPGKKPGTGLPRPTASPALRQRAAVHRDAVDQVPRSPGQPLAVPPTEDMKACLGADFCHVPVHADGAARAPTAEARASTLGRPAAITPIDAAAVRTTVSSGGLPLEASVRDDMESRFAADFSSVRVHTGAAAARSAQAVSASAYTVGEHIVLGQQAPSMASGTGRGILAHELAHIVQRQIGPVAGIPISDNMSVSDPQDSFERAAANAARAALASGADHPDPMARSPRRDPAESAGAVRYSPGPVQAVHVQPHTRVRHGMRDVIQRCFLCGDPACVNGAICHKTPDFGGLLPAGSATMRVKYYNQRQGHGGRQEEWEHAVPGAAYRSANMGALYRSAPVMAIPTGVHRGAVAGEGGGISSTGSSSTAKQYSQETGNVLATNFAEGLRIALVDGLNAAMSHNQNLDEWVNAQLRIINGHLERGQITQQEAADLQNFVMNSKLDRQQRPDLYGGT